jgi:hypothetical protein
MDNLEMLKMMAARNALVIPSPKKSEFSWFGLMQSSPLLSNYWGFSDSGVDYGEATNEGAEKVHSGPTQKDG